MSGAKIRPPKPAPELTKPITTPRLLMNHLCTTVVAGMNPMNESAMLSATPKTKPNSPGCCTVPVSAVNTAVNKVPNITIGRTPYRATSQPVSGATGMLSRPRISRAVETTPRLHLTSGSMAANSGATTKYTAPVAVPYRRKPMAPCW